MTNNIETVQVIEAFDKVAETFERDLENDITRQLRKRVYALIQSLVLPGASFLDINCGIGIDTIALTQQGYEGIGVDITPAMIEQARLRAERHEVKTKFFVSSFEELSSLSGKTFDVVLSNFGGLNCLQSLEKVAEEVTTVTKHGGHFVAVVMPPVCLWEIAAGVARLDASIAFRRLKNEVLATGFQGKSFRVFYHSPRKFASHFRGRFEVQKIRGFNIFSPPPHAIGFKKNNRRFASFLERIDESIAGAPLLRSCGDHYMVVLKKVR